MDKILYGSGDLYAMAGEPIFNVPEDREATLEELEEQHAYLMRQYESCLENGQPAKAQEFLEKAQELEDVINDMEYEN